MAPPPPLPPLDFHPDTDKDVVTVLVTGFGPFQDRYPVNPSWEITKSLPSLVPNLDPLLKPIRVVPCEKAIRVSYAEARKRIPDMLNSNADSINLVLNIGMASGRRFYTAERYARRSGYATHKDVDGLVPDPDEAERFFPDCPAIMTTSLDFPTLLAQWQDIVRNAAPDSALGDADCRPSDDAGRFLCDYTYFNTLTWFGRHNAQLEEGTVKDRPAMFLHVPAESTESDLDRGRAVAIAMIQAMVSVYQS